MYAFIEGGQFGFRYQGFEQGKVEFVRLGSWFGEIEFAGGRDGLIVSRRRRLDCGFQRFQYGKIKFFRLGDGLGEIEFVHIWN